MFYQELQDIRSTLTKYTQTRDSEKLLVRIEQIVPGDQQEEVLVTFWKAEKKSSQGSEGLFELSKIC